MVTDSKRWTSSHLLYYMSLVDYLRPESPQPAVPGFQAAGENQLVRYADSDQPLEQFSYCIWEATSWQHHLHWSIVERLKIQVIHVDHQIFLQTFSKDGTSYMADDANFNVSASEPISEYLPHRELGKISLWNVMDLIQNSNSLSHERRHIPDLIAWRVSLRKLVIVRNVFPEH